jgi:hypothetical protein
MTSLVRDESLSSNVMVHEIFLVNLKDAGSSLQEGREAFIHQPCFRLDGLLQAVEAPRVVRGRISHITYTNG